MGDELRKTGMEHRELGTVSLPQIVKMYTTGHCLHFD